MRGQLSFYLSYKTKRVGKKRLACKPVSLRDTLYEKRKKRVIGQKELVKNPATLVESSVAGFLSSLKQDEGWTKRVGEKCFKPLRYKAFLCLHLP